MSEESRSSLHIITNIFLGLLFPLIFIFIASVVVIPSIIEQQTSMCSEMHEIIHSDVLIYSTEDGTAIEGEFFLGCGYINTYLVYFVYTGDDINGFEREMIPADNVVVFRDSEVPHMVKKTVYKMRVMDVMTQIKGCLPGEVIELHVPKNTLIKDV